MKTFPNIFISDAETSAAIVAALKNGQIRKLAPRLYSSNVKDSAEQIIRQNRWQVIDLLLPGAVVSHRSALERSASPAGRIYITSTYPRKISLPGLEIVQLQGVGPITGDMQMLSFYIASEARALLENLSPARSRRAEAKVLPRPELERKLADLLRARGEAGLNSIRDDSRKIAPLLGLEKEQKKLDKLIGSLLGTRTAKLTEPRALAYARREPYAPEVIEKVDKLQSLLAQSPTVARPFLATPTDEFYHQSFFDAYFSNYIEGTRFKLDVAMEIVSSGIVPLDRPEDGHDILGTYQLVASLDEMSQSPRTAEAFIERLVQRHSIIMAGRPEKNPGQFKEKKNFAGQTEFVSPDMVTGTLNQGFEICNILKDPFARAITIAFLITEVHPFDDGNGRTARAAMNAELIAEGQTRIIVPSVFRSEYIQSLKRLTKHKDPRAFIRVMDYLQKFVSRIDFSSLTLAEKTLKECHAFEDPSDAVRLKMPEKQIEKIH